MLAALILQSSLLIQPVYLDDEPPELRSARNILLIDTSSEQKGGSGLSPKDALAFAFRLRERIDAGESFEELARDHSNHANAGRGAVLGNAARGMLAEPLDGFLFAAEIGEVSDPLLTEGAVHLLQRIETSAAVLQIMLLDTGQSAKERIEALRAELLAGADFAELAREHSEDRDSAARGGQFAIYERGTRDALLKAAAFGLEVGELSEVIRSGTAYHLIKRVSVEEVDPELRQGFWKRFGALYISHRNERDLDSSGRSRIEAQVLLDEVLLRLEAGDDFSQIAGEINDDPGGRERGGDIGWVYRFAPALPRYFDRGFLLEVGQVSDPFRTSAGILLLKRTQ